MSLTAHSLPCPHALLPRPLACCLGAHSKHLKQTCVKRASNCLGALASQSIAPLAHHAPLSLSLSLSLAALSLVAFSRRSLSPLSLAALSLATPRLASLTVFLSFARSLTHSLSDGASIAHACTSIQTHNTHRSATHNPQTMFKRTHPSAKHWPESLRCCSRPSRLGIPSRTRNLQKQPRGSEHAIRRSAKKNTFEFLGQTQNFIVGRDNPTHMRQSRKLTLD